ncbi:MAG: class I SAM-dependent rRNA methyltransferase [Polyangiaceae bacterium]|nr:class I SAM-dependent rRNA methyltransferase [Polyangiaceae bacterium]
MAPAKGLSAQASATGEVESGPWVLPAALGGAIDAGHPWVYRNHVPVGMAAPTGSWVQVRAGGSMAWALYDHDSPIALRIYSRMQQPDSDWLKQRVRTAYQLRQRCLNFERTDCYRLVSGEGDRLPGIVVDVYGPFAVISCDGAATESLVPWVVDAIRDVVGVRGILLKRRASDEEETPRLSSVWGKEPPPRFSVRENGLSLSVELWSGQKTGLFLDHRENRELIEQHADGCEVLNLFSYTGAFSLYALRGGASHVTSVDVAEDASRAASSNLEKNGFSGEHHEAVCADVFDYLRAQAKLKKRFGIVISDPPSFARRKTQLRGAQRAYDRLHRAALECTEDGGLFAAASCTSQMSPELFRQSLARAAAEAGVSLQIIADRGHAVDHPIQTCHPEGRYLKFMLCVVRRDLS